MLAICSPAGAVAPDVFAAALDRLRLLGVPFKVMPHAAGRCGTYSAPLAQRIADMQAALLDPEVDAILCGRGGYGAVQMLEAIEPLVSPDNPKWLIGFSDITALHALWQQKGLLSIHAPMLRALALEQARAKTNKINENSEREGDCGALQSKATPSLASPLDPSREKDPFLQILEITDRPKACYPCDDRPKGCAPCDDRLKGCAPCVWGAHPLNRHGEARGRLVGGNLSVLMGLYGTPYFPVRQGDILVIEDVCEPIYKIERMLWQLRLGGTLAALGGLVVGQFTHTDPDANYPHPYDMVAEITAPYAYPVAFGAPVGHSWPNVPLLLGAPTRLASSPASSALIPHPPQ